MMHCSRAILAACAVASAYSKNNNEASRVLQYGRANAASAPVYRAQPQAVYAKPQKVYVATRYNAPEQLNLRAQQTVHYQAAHYDRGVNTVHREYNDYNCGYAPVYTPTYVPPPQYKTYAKPKKYKKPAPKEDDGYETKEHTVTITYNSKAEAEAAGYGKAQADAEAKSEGLGVEEGMTMSEAAQDGHRRLMFELRRALTGHGCPPPKRHYDYTLLWMFVALIILIVVVWWCCKCFDHWCLWHPRGKDLHSDEDDAHRKRREQLEQMENEAEHGIVNGRRSKFLMNNQGMPW
jgi:hypothetical protein